MESKLLERIHEIESVAPISSDEELIAALDRIVEKEEELPWEKRDYDLIEEAIEYKLRLEGVDIEECGRRADELSKQILQKINDEKKGSTANKRHSIFRRVACVLATAMTLVVLTVGTYALNPSFRDFTNKMYNQLKDKIWYHSDNIDYIITHDTLEFSSIDDLVSDERFGSLALPYELSEGYEITRIEANDYGEFLQVTISIQKESQFYPIYIMIPSSENIEEDKTIRIGDYDVAVEENSNSITGVFKSNSTAYYQVEADSMESLFEIINSIKRR